MRTIVINSSVFNHSKIVGVPRVLYETLLAIDKCSDDWKNDYRIDAVCPFAYDGIQLNHINLVIYNPHKREKNKCGIELWGQFDYVNYVNRVKGINLDICMEHPFFKNDISYFHDCQPEHFQGSYNTKIYSQLVNNIKRLKRKRAALSSKLIIAVSEYTKNDLINTFGIEPDKIDVVYNGWEHFERINEDDSIFQKKPELLTRKYCFSLGSFYEHKNLRWIVEAAKHNPDIMFVISGNNKVAQYSSSLVDDSLENIWIAGYLSDGEIKSLMKSCMAFIHPSLSEGFGLPPLEALYLDKKIILSNTTCLPEVFEQSVYYINPRDYVDCDIKKIIEGTTSGREKVLMKCSWDIAAQRILKCIEKYLKDEKKN